MVYALGYLPDASANKVVTTRIRKAGVSSTTNLYTTLMTADYTQGITYLDALSRPSQSISIGQSPLAKDIVQPFAYDSLSSLSYLPYVSTSRDGLNKATALSCGGSYTAGDQYTFYQQANLQRATSSAPYAKTTIENSPLGRALEQGAPGTDWQPGSTHTVRPEFHTNGTSDVRTWSLSGPGSYYDPGTLVMSKVTDENGNIVYGFTDKMGRTILKRVQSATSTWLETYYVYDTRGNLVMQVPPKASAASWSTTIRDQYCFQYTYDVRNRLVEKITPGAAAIYYIYDPLGRLVLTQDGNLRTLSKWAFIKYDIKNRPVMSGLYSNTSNTTRPTMQANIVDPLYASGAWYEERGTTLHGYTNQSFPTTNSPSAPVEVLTVAYYDTYDFNYNGANDWTYTSQGISGEGSQDNSFGLPTGSKKLVIGDTAWIRTYQFYDRFGRVIQVRNNNHRSAVVDNLTTIVYDFEGKVLQTKTYHNAGGSNQTTTITRNEYSTLGRLVRIYHSINGAQETVNAYYKYNELGQVVEKNLHCIDCGDVNPANSSSAAILTRTAYSAGEQNLLATQSVTLSPGFDTGVGGLFNARIIGTAATIPASGGTYMQSVDYRYHIRGWLQSINNAQLGNDSGTTNDDANDYFGLELAYNTDAGMSNTLFYNGNISAIKWKSNGASGAADQRSYKYSYDKSDKLLAATFQAHNGSAWTKEAGTLDETMTYDANGNILTLNRKQNQRSLSGINVMSTPQPLDDLAYTYAAGNQMSKVEDAVATTVGTGDFKNGSTSTTEYTYNTSGGMTQDLNKGISAITYNVLGKPSQITMSSGTVTNYTYDAAGTKLKMAVTVGGTTTTTDYVGSFVYVNSALSFLSSPEGRVVKNGSKFEYQYAISDHQGNTRILFTSAAPAPVAVTATFEGDANDQSGQFANVSNVVSFTAANHTSGGIKVVRMNQGYPVGPSKSLKVYPGDKVDMEVYGYYESSSGYGSNNTVALMITAVAGAFGGALNGAGETGKIYDGITSALGGFGLGPNPGDTRPSAFLNYILFDQNYKALDMGWTIIPTSANFAKQQMTIPQVTVKEAGYIFVYLSYEDQSNNYVYFDDFKVSHTKGNVIQSSEYYPFGMQTATSWTRENTTGNNFLGNGGTELNTTSQVYDLDYRNYDPILGRMNQTDPLADQFSSLSPYHYSYNNPVGFNDPSGALPWSADFAESYTGSDYGSRNAWAKMVAHGGMAQFVGGAGEGWDGYVGGFGLADGGFGNSTYYSYEKIGSVAAGKGEAVDKYDWVEHTRKENQGGSGDASSPGWHFNIHEEMSASVGGINLAAQLNPWLGFVYQSQARYLGKISGGTPYTPKRLNPNTTTYVSKASLAVYGFSGTAEATIEYDKSHNVVSETQSLGLGVYGFGIQANFDEQGIKDIRIGLDDGVTLGAFLVGSLNFQMGGIYVFH